MYLCIYFHLQLAKHFCQTRLDSSDTEHRTRKTPTTKWLFDRQWLLAVCGKLFLATELFTRCLSCNTLYVFSLQIAALEQSLQDRDILISPSLLGKKIQKCVLFRKCNWFFWIETIRDSVSFCTDILTGTTWFKQ